MKSFILQKVIVVWLLLSTQVFSEDAYLKNIDNFTLQEIKKYLIDDQQSMEDFISFAKNNNLDFSISTEEKTIPSFNNDPYKILDINENKVKIDELVSDMYMRQTINFPTSTVLMHLDSDDMEDVFGAKKHSKDFPSIDVQSINYIDNSKEEVNRKAEWEDYNDLYVDVNTSKPMERMGLKISYTLPLIKEYYISKQKPIVFKEGTIKLENMLGGQVQFSLSNDALKKRIISVDAIHTSGKSLRKSGESMYSHPSKANMAYMKKTSILLKELIGRIDNKIMFDALFGNKSLDSIEAVKNALKKIPKPTKEEQKQKSFWTYNFTGDIEKVRVVVGLGRTEMRTKKLVIKKHSSMQQSSLGYYEARDAQTKKEGFVGKDGVWLVQPKYMGLSLINDYYYRGEYKDDLNQMYWIDSKKKTLKRVTYELRDTDIYHNKIVIVLVKKNHKYGLLNVKNGKFIQPAKYDNIYYRKGVFKGTIKGIDIVFDKNGRELRKKTFK